MAFVRFVGFLSAGPVSTDVSAMEKMGSDGVLVLSNGCWTTTRSDVLEPIGKSFADGRSLSTTMIIMMIPVTTASSESHRDTTTKAASWLT